MDVSRYFDNAATTPIDSRVADEVDRVQRHVIGNAHSIHEAGREARALVEEARARVASLLGAEDPSQIVFTSGATESNNWVISQFDRIAISPFEHSSAREPGLHLGATVLANDGYHLETPNGEPSLLVVMGVNNETGAMIEPPPIAGLALHRDLTQSVGKVPIDLTGVACAACSAHKFGGPKGVGALYLRDPGSIEPLLRGGGQEAGLRAGTLNVPGVAGMGLAAALACEERETRHRHAATLRAVVLEEIDKMSDWTSASALAADCSPFILSLSFAGVQGETLVIELDARGFALSSGAACSSTSPEPSPVLLALGFEDSLARGTIRISFGPQNTLEATRDLGRALAEVLERLRR